MPVVGYETQRPQMIDMTDIQYKRALYNQQRKQAQQQQLLQGIVSLAGAFGEMKKKKAQEEFLRKAGVLKPVMKEEKDILYSPQGENEYFGYNLPISPADLSPTTRQVPSGKSEIDLSGLSQLGQNYPGLAGTQLGDMSRWGGPSEYKVPATMGGIKSPLELEREARMRVNAMISDNPEIQSKIFENPALQTQLIDNEVSRLRGIYGLPMVNPMPLAGASEKKETKESETPLQYDPKTEKLQYNQKTGKYRVVKK